MRLLGGLPEGGGLEFRILGPLQVLDEGRVLPLGGAKQRSTLAMLLLGRNRVVSRDQLIDGLWGASPPPSAGPTLDTYVSRLRRVLQDDGGSARLVTQPPGYRLRVEAGELDLERFETLLDQARSGALGRRSRGRGEGSARGALAVPRRTARGPRPCTLRPGRDPTPGGVATGCPGAAAGGGPGRRPPRRGRRRAGVTGGPLSLPGGSVGPADAGPVPVGAAGEALLAFDRARRTLAEELGVDPGPPLKQLHQQILQQDPSLEIRTESAAPPRWRRRPADPASRTGHAGAPPSAPRQHRPRSWRRNPTSDPLPRSGRPPTISAETPGTHRRSADPRGAAWAVFIPRVVGGGGDATSASAPARR